MNPNDPDQLGWRETLRKAKEAYASARYEGDLADDVFARLDAAEADASPTPPAEESPALDPMRIDRPAARRFDWRPLLAVAAAVAVIATTWWTLRQTAPRKSDDGSVATVEPNRANGPSAAAEPAPSQTTVAEANPGSDEDETMFSVVPSYQSMSFALPESLTLASLDEYSRQSQADTTSQTTSSDPTQTR